MKKELILISSINYNNEISKLIKKLPQGEKIGYVTLNKTFNSMTQLLQKNQIDSERFFFIDLITPTVLKINKKKNCVYLDSLNDSSEFADKLLNLVKINKIDTVIFDSISSFLVYKTDQEIIEFFNYIISFLEKLKTNITIIALKEDSNKSSIKQIKMNVDNFKTIN